MGQLEELQSMYEEGIVLLLTRLDHGTSRNLLPYNLALDIYDYDEMAWIPDVR
ncbi:MAG: hypothetical protein P9X26_07900 [Candidatus Stygibacter frigidus]|nr:hypothetical protein [Candidatus Stygibacter frigidus]